MKENKGSYQVILRRSKSMISIILNRPEAINSLSEEMIDIINDYLQIAVADDQCKYILFYGNGSKGFCAGGDVKELARLGKQKENDKVDTFFQKEYALDLLIHTLSKPVIVIADGVTMGGGLGISAGAAISIATERTHMAMPETRIGFFPDVGSTGWMFTKCPKGYPEYLGLTGYYMEGIECVRLGFATHFMNSSKIGQLITELEQYQPEGVLSKKALQQKIIEKISKYLDFNIPVNRDMDNWVATYFAGKSDLSEILESLSNCILQKNLCKDVFTSIAERSPTALVLTLKLLRHNEGRPLAEVFDAELKAALYISRHPDYIEGVRARLIDHDDKPRWKPDKISKVDISGFEL
jgi:Enoyl-CoA hydratase/carnithine racemase